MTSNDDIGWLTAFDARLGRPGARPRSRGTARAAVDLVVLNHAPADLAHRVLRDAVLVSERNPSARIRFEVRSRNEYFDLEPILRRYRRAG
jgi:hypothetical protein